MSNSEGQAYRDNELGGEQTLLLHASAGQTGLLDARCEGSSRRPGNSGIVDEHPLGCAALCDQSIAGSNDVLGAQLPPNLDRERFATEHVDDRQRPEALAARQLIGREVRALGLVRTPRYEAIVPSHDHPPSTGGLAAQLQALLGIEPVRLISAEAMTGVTS